MLSQGTSNSSTTDVDGKAASSEPAIFRHMQAIGPAVR